METHGVFKYFISKGSYGRETMGIHIQPSDVHMEVMCSFTMYNLIVLLSIGHPFYFTKL